MRDARVDAYIAKAQPFAQEILTHLRELMHRASPEIKETIKWGMPFFELQGVILANMAGFKQHCSFGLWGPEMAAILGREAGEPGAGMGTFGRIAARQDLPSDKVMLGYLRQAVRFVASGERTKSLVRPAKKSTAAKPQIAVPEELAAALKKNKAAAATFADFSPSCKREYTDWIAEAKRPETKEKRVVQAVEWMAEGKQRMWKYQKS